MLERIRDSSRSIGTYLILGAIIIVFVVYFGPAGSSCAGPEMSAITYAAKVDGKDIPVRDFQLEYENRYRNLQAQMGDNFDARMAEQFGLRDIALDAVIQQRLLVDQALREGIAVTNDEIAEEIRRIPAFQQDGHFDFETYQQALRNGGLRPAQYEEKVRESLLIGKLLAKLRLSVKVSEDEIREAFEHDNDRAEIAFVRFAPTEFVDEAEVSADEVAAFLATEDGQARVKADFEAKSWRYQSPKRVRAQHILASVDEDAPEAEVQAAEQKIRDARAEIEAGADFGEVAQRLSDDPGSKEKGGDLGLFGPGTMAKPFEDAAMNLEIGELSEPVRTRFGFHLIRVNEIEEAQEKTLEDVQDEIARELLANEKAKEIAKQRAEAALAALQEGGSLEALFPAPDADATEENRAPVADRSGVFAVRGEFIPKVGMSSELRAAVAAMEGPGAVGGVFDVMGNFVVAEVVSREQPDLSAFDDERESIEERLRMRRENEHLEAYVQSLREAAKVEMNEALLARF